MRRMALASASAEPDPRARFAGASGGMPSTCDSTCDELRPLGLGKQVPHGLPLPAVAAFADGRRGEPRKADGSADPSLTHAVARHAGQPRPPTSRL